MIPTTITMENGLYGPSLMKFTLTYEGELRANGSPKQKWDIRKHFHPQLQELWRITPALEEVRRLRHLPRGGYWNIEIHHSQPGDRSPPKNLEDYIDTLENKKIGGKEFLPLVRNSLALQCGLQILFLRKEEPGRIYQGGDIDNRIKTLLDALAVPNLDQVVADPGADYPIYCLLEDEPYKEIIGGHSAPFVSPQFESP